MLPIRSDEAQMIYQHFLVPIDDTPISAENVRTAIQIALRFDARITFFHATLDFGATNDGAILRSVEADAYPEMALGSTNAVLTKALAAARALGVAADACARVCSKPAEAIVEAAQSRGCDLIVMASRGYRGWLHSSQTERVLRRAPVALLVTRVDTNAPLHADERAIGIIEDEHRSIAVVAESLRDIARNAPRPLAPQTLRELEHILAYLADFPGCVHHPKEEEFIHRLLRQRHPAANVVLLEVEAQHVTEHELFASLQAAVDELKVEPQAADEAFTLAALALAGHVMNHVGLEEREVLPLARAHLTGPDWEEVARAFAENGGPNYGDLSVAEFRRLFSHIANTVADVRTPGGARGR
jgi:nucleotide-binding universal stress UspA family protein/hemerythrin-like domain-containing protein